MNAPVLSRIESRPDVSHPEMAHAIRFLAIDADAHGLFVAAATVRGGSAKLEPTPPPTAERPALFLTAANGLGAVPREGL